MVRADQGIRGRATPRSKTRSSASAARASSSPGSAAPASATSSSAATQQQISKAAKRALKRAELVAHAQHNAPASSSASGSSSGAASALSKSALKRLKKRQQSNLAGNREGMKDLEAAVDDLQAEMRSGGVSAQIDGGDELERDEEEVEAEEPTALPHQAANAAPKAKPSVATEKARKRALAHELQRQPHILSDPAYAQNPFAALRLHAQNTMAFDRPTLAARAKMEAARTSRPVDEEMA